ncbi:MAG: M23 family metallopeptidase [Thermodesulfobacteriota bacterium]|nr:M23 family metallopeptidase [Thermodesulfobacteriota bacterium]
MNKKIKIWFYTGSYSKINEIAVSKNFLFILILFFLTSASGLFYAGIDYLKLKKTALETRTLNEKIQVQDREIMTQRMQIQDFAREINTIKKKVVSLSEFENKVRVIADIKQNSDPSALFGTGGLAYEQLDASFSLDQRHNSLIREMHKKINQIDKTSTTKLYDYQELLKHLNRKRNTLASTPSIRPVKGWITSGFGYRESPFTGKKEFHSGLDIANKKGTKIAATAAGKVSYADKKMFIGKLVIIDHGHGTFTKYGHLDKILVKRGDKVKRGDIIGRMGNSGRSTGPHVHYEVKINGISVNPQKYILD